jgi:hypothetical protein
MSNRSYLSESAEDESQTPAAPTLDLTDLFGNSYHLDAEVEQMPAVSETGTTVGYHHTTIRRPPPSKRTAWGRLSSTWTTFVQAI